MNANTKTILTILAVILGLMSAQANAGEILTSSKLTAYEFEVTKTVDVPASVTTKYDLKFLVEQRERIIAAAEQYAADRQRELNEVDALITEATKLGIIAKPVEAIKAVEVPLITK